MLPILPRQLVGVVSNSTATRALCYSQFCSPSTKTSSVQFVSRVVDEVIEKVVGIKVVPSEREQVKDLEPKSGLSHASTSEHVILPAAKKRRTRVSREKVGRSSADSPPSTHVQNGHVARPRKRRRIKSSYPTSTEPRQSSSEKPSLVDRARHTPQRASRRIGSNRRQRATSSRKRNEAELPPAKSPYFKASMPFPSKPDVDTLESFRQSLLEQPIFQAAEPEEEYPSEVSSDINVEIDRTWCIVCARRDEMEKMILCDACSSGCHTFCMRPKRKSAPHGVWLCPKCFFVAKKHEIELSHMERLRNGRCFECLRRGVDVKAGEPVRFCGDCEMGFHVGCLRQYHKVSKWEIHDPNWICHTCVGFKSRLVAAKEGRANRHFPLDQTSQGGLDQEQLVMTAVHGHCHLRTALRKRSL